MPPNPQPPQYPMVAQHRGSLESLHRPQKQKVTPLPVFPRQNELESTLKRLKKYFPQTLFSQRQGASASNSSTSISSSSNNSKVTASTNGCQPSPANYGISSRSAFFLIRNSDVILGEIGIFFVPFHVTITLFVCKMVEKYAFY